MIITTHDPRTCENCSPCHDCALSERVLPHFLEQNKASLIRQYCDYLESMLMDGMLDELEDFPIWIEEEYAVAFEYREKGTPLNDYIL